MRWMWSRQGCQAKEWASRGMKAGWPCLGTPPPPCLVARCTEPVSSSQREFCRAVSKTCLLQLHCSHSVRLSSWGFPQLLNVHISVKTIANTGRPKEGVWWDLLKTRKIETPSSGKHEALNTWTQILGEKKIQWVIQTVWNLCAPEVENYLVSHISVFKHSFKLKMLGKLG